jgi:hypothetical protein
MVIAANADARMKDLVMAGFHDELNAVEGDNSAAGPIDLDARQDRALRVGRIHDAMPVIMPDLLKQNGRQAKDTCGRHVKCNTNSATHKAPSSREFAQISAEQAVKSRAATCAFGVKRK